MEDARQLLRLRTLRVQRARERCVEAAAAVAQAEEAVRERQREVERRQQAVDALAHAVVHTLAPRLPRWIDVAGAQREHLAELLERAEYALIDDEHRLEEAQERLQEARAEVTRALAREDAVRGLAQDLHRAAQRVQDQRSELEIEDTTCRRRA